MLNPECPSEYTSASAILYVYIVNVLKRINFIHQLKYVILW